MFNNGIIIQGNKLLPHIDKQTVIAQHYRGILSGTTWPLEGADDMESRRLSDEVTRCWLQRIDNIFTSTDPVFIKQYLQHCKELNVTTRCILVESYFDYPCNKCNWGIDELEYLGCEFVASDMQESCSYEDVCEDLFEPFVSSLNSNFLFDNDTDAQHYVEFRESLVRKGYDLESYYYPRIVRLSEIHLQT